MESNPINCSLQSINLEKRSAIIHCHIDKKRLWFLNNYGELDYYSQLGIEPPLRISIDKNVSPKRLWSNHDGTRFIVETIDFSLYYFQTKSNLFLSPETIGMKNFFRIGALKNGPVSTIFFDDDPKDPQSTKQIFIIVKGGGALVLSIETSQDEVTKEITTYISDFHPFPSLFTNYNILDMKIFRFIERKPNFSNLKNTAQLACESYEDISLEFDKNLYNNVFDIKELVKILKNIRNKIEAPNELFEKFLDIKYKLDDFDIEKENNNDNAFNNDTLHTGNQFEISDASTIMLDKIENFLKYEENQKKDIDIQFNEKVSTVKDNWDSINQNLQTWLSCVNEMKLVQEKSDKAIMNSYKLAYLYQQLYQFVVHGNYKKVDQIFIENEDEPQSPRKSTYHEEEEEDNNNNSSRSNNKFNMEDYKANLDFDLDFISSEKKKKEKKKDRKKDKSSHSTPEILMGMKIKIRKIFNKLRQFLKSEEIHSSYKRLIDFYQDITDQTEKIDDINKSIKTIKIEIKKIFEKINVQLLKFDDNYASTKDENFPQNKEDKYLTYHYVSKINDQVKSMLELFQKKSKMNINFLNSIDSFCNTVMPFFEDVNLTNFDDNPFNIIRTYIIFLAEDRIIRCYSDKKPLKIFKVLNKSFDKKGVVKTNEIIFNSLSQQPNFVISRIDNHSRLVHKPLKTIPSHKRPTFYIICWDNEKSVNICYSFKFKRMNKRKKISHEKDNLDNENEIIYKSKIENDDELFIFKRRKKFEFEPNMKLIYYQITPSGLLVVQNGQRADSKAIAYEISSFIVNDIDVSSSRGKLLWTQEITDYSLLPILNCDFSLESGLIIYNSMNIKLISRKNVDLNSFNELIQIKNPKTIMKVRKYLALTPMQENETFFILLIYAMDQLYQLEKKYYSIKREKSQFDQIFALRNLKVSLNDAKIALTKLLNNASCSKMAIFLFLMDDNKLNNLINYFTEDKNEDKHFERFRRFRIEYLVNLIESLDLKNRNQQEVLLLMAFDLLIQLFSTRNNKNIYINDSSINDDEDDYDNENNKGNNNKNIFDVDKSAIDVDNDLEIIDSFFVSYFKKSFTDKIDVDDITSLTSKYGSSLSTSSLAYYIVKCFPILDSASFYAAENESQIENAYSKIYKYLVQSSDEQAFENANKALLLFIGNYLEKIVRRRNEKKKKVTLELIENNSKEIDHMIKSLFLYGIEQHDDEEWFLQSFTNFFKAIEKVLILPEIPKTILSLFIYVQNQNQNKIIVDTFTKFDPVIHFLNEYYSKFDQDKIDLLFSIYVSMERLKEIESLRKSSNYDITLAIYRLSRLRVQAAKLLEQLHMTSVAIDVVLDDNSPSTAIKFASSLKDENTMLYLVRTASRKDKNTNFDSIYSNVVDTKRNTTSNQKLYDVLMCIPDDKLKQMENLQESIFKTLEEIDEKSNEELKKIHILLDKMKQKDEGPSNSDSFMLNSPFSSCDLCHNTILKKDFFAFPCGHMFHTSCYNERRDMDQNDREKMSLFHPNYQTFTINANHCLCPICGLGAVELIDTPMYSLLDNQTMNALSQNTQYINEVDDDDN